MTKIDSRFWSSCWGWLPSRHRPRRPASASRDLRLAQAAEPAAAAREPALESGATARALLSMSNRTTAAGRIG